MNGSHDIKNRFWPNDLTAEQERDCDALRLAYERLADMIASLAPQSREQSLALTKLEASSFWAIAAISRH